MAAIPPSNTNFEFKPVKYKTISLAGVYKAIQNPISPRQCDLFILPRGLFGFGSR